MSSTDRPDDRLSEVDDERICLTDDKTILRNEKIHRDICETETANTDQVEIESRIESSCFGEDRDKIKAFDVKDSDIHVQGSENNSLIEDSSETIELSKTNHKEPDSDKGTDTNLNCDNRNNQDLFASTESDNKNDTESKVIEFDDKKDAELEYFSDQSESGDEYESAEEGEDIQTDSTNLKELEETLTEEEKEERRNTSKEMKEEGNQLFKDGSYKSAIRLYSRGLRTCPLKFEKDRSVLYANRGACKVKLEEFEAAIKDCSKSLELNPDYMKVLQRRAELYEKLDKLDEALADYQKILELDPGQHKARAACMKLPDMIKERNEKLKEEMMGKLKELGNMVLRPFGLSTNNFKMQQDPNTGGYSVNFVQNPDNGS